MNYSANDILEVLKNAKNYNNFLIDIVTKTINSFHCNKIMDFGCADGYFIERISEICPRTNIFGVEIDENSLDICRNKKLNVYAGLDKSDSEFDLIYSFNVLEHIEDDIDTLIQFHNKLSENGRIIVYVPALKFLFSSVDKKAGHFRRYSKNDLKEKILKSGFKIEKLIFCDCFGVPATMLFNLKNMFIKDNSGNITVFEVKLYDFIFPVSKLLDKLIFKYLCGKNLLVIAKKSAN